MLGLADRFGDAELSAAVRLCAPSVSRWFAPCALSAPSGSTASDPPDASAPPPASDPFAGALELPPFVAPPAGSLDSPAFLEPVSGTRGLVMVAHGMARRQLRYQFGFAVSTVVAVLIGSRWGVTGVAAALVVAAYIGLVPSLFYCFRGTAVSPGGFLRAIGRPVLGSLYVLLAGALILYLMPPSPLRLLVGGLVGALVYFAAWWFTSSMRARGRELFGLVFRKLRGRRSGKASR